MITLNKNTEFIDIPITNRCRYSPEKCVYLWLKNTYTKNMYFFPVMNENSAEYAKCRIQANNILSDIVDYEDIYECKRSLEYFIFRIKFRHCLPHGEYEYYLTGNDPGGLDIDTNNIKEIETNLFSTGKLNPVFSVGNIIFADKGDSIFHTSGKCSYELHPDFILFSSGILKYNKSNEYHERGKGQSGYTERS